MNTKQIKQALLRSIPLVLVGWFGNKISYSYQTAGGRDLYTKLTPFLKNLTESLTEPMPSLNIIDVIFGIAAALLFWLFITYKRKNRKNFRNKEEYGGAKWGSQKDIYPYMDNKNPDNNVILTQTERLTMGRPKSPRYARNKNIEVIGGSGSGKTRFFVKPNLMQMHSSYVVTDPKGTVLVECGEMLKKGRPKRDSKGKIICVKDKNGNPVKDRNGRNQIVYEPYKIKVFNTIDFNKSMHYNPFAYIRPETREQDILKFVEVLIKNTTSKDAKGDDFWVKAEKLLYTSYIALIFAACPKEQHNFETLIEFINASECRENDESFMNSMDYAFYYLEKWLDNDWTDDEEIPDEVKVYGNLRNLEPTDEQKSLGRFAVRQYKAYKLAAGKTAKSILISCSTRLAPFSIDKILEITRDDEMELDTIGDRLTALFVIISDTDSTFNFLVAIMYSQMFNLLCTKADNNPDGSGRLKYHVRCLLDEFSNIGEIPEFDKLIATIRSREISVSIILQAKSQLKTRYKDSAETIEGNCDTMLFLGGKEKTTLKDLSESLGKETIDLFNININRGQSESTGVNYQKTGRELKTQDELQVMDNSECILQIRGLRPFLSKKYDIEKHSRYSQLLDFSRKNYFNVADHIAKRRKRKADLSKNTEVEEYDFIT